MGSAAAVGPSPQVRGHWIKMAEALPRHVSCMCILLFSLLLCTRVRAVVVGAAAVEFAVASLSISLSLSPVLSISLSISFSLFFSLTLSPSLSLPLSLSSMPPCSGSHFGFLVPRPFSQPTSFLTDLCPREKRLVPPPLSLSCLFNDPLCSPHMPLLSFPVLSLFILTHPFLTYPASW